MKETNENTIVKDSYNCCFSENNNYRSSTCCRSNKSLERSALNIIWVNRDCSLARSIT